jgi:hypothetical protein
MPVQRPRQLLRAPVRMSMRNLDELCTPSDGLWGPMGPDQYLQLIKIMRSQVKRTVGALMTHGVVVATWDIRQEI